MKRLILITAVAACDGAGSEPVACDVTPVQAPGPGAFVDVSAASGIQAGNFVPNPATPIPINDHSRLAFADLDGDGCDDIVAHDLFPNPKAGIPFTHVVLKSNCDGTFTDISAASGLANVQAGFFAFGDVDNDGDEDCFAGLDIPLPGLASSLWLNDGTGHFTEKAASGLEGTAGDTVAANAVFADFNRDAKLDVFVGNGPDQLRRARRALPRQRRRHVHEVTEARGRSSRARRTAASRATTTTTATSTSSCRSTACRRAARRTSSTRTMAPATSPTSRPRPASRACRPATT